MSRKTVTRLRTVFARTVGLEPRIAYRAQTLPRQLTGKQRAVAINVGATQGLVGYVASGDRVDIYYETAGNGGTVLGLLASNVLVMRAAAAGAPAILRLNAPQAQTMALASDSGTLWFLLRPAGDAKEPPRKAITTQQIQQLITGSTKR